MEQKPKITEKNGRDKNGKFLTGNNGKPKGAVNKTTKDIKEFITAFLNDKAFEIPQIWDSLEYKDKATLYLHLLKIVMPKPLNEAGEINNKNSVFGIMNIDPLSTEEIKRISQILEDEV